MSNLQIIQRIISILLKGPTPAYKIAQQLLKEGFKSENIYLTIMLLTEEKQIRISENWNSYLNPPVDSE